MMQHAGMHESVRCSQLRVAASAGCSEACRDHGDAPHFLLQRVPAAAYAYSSRRSCLGTMQVTRISTRMQVLGNPTLALLLMQLSGEPPAEDSLINVDVIHPATEKHVLKYSTQQYFVVRPTVCTAPGFLRSVTILLSGECTHLGRAIDLPCAGFDVVGEA